MSLLGIAAIIGAGSAVVGGVGSLFESKSNRSYNELQTANAMEFQREMFQRQNEEYRNRFNLENEEYRNRLQLEQNYIDPSNIAQRYAGIGVNPGSVLAPSQGSATVFGSPSPSLSSPSVSSAPSAPTPGYLNMSASGDTASYMEKIGSLLSNISSSQKDSVEAQNVSRMADDLLKNLELKNRLEAQNIMDKEMEVIVKKNTALEKAFNDLRLQRADLNYKIISGQNVEIDSELKQWNIFATQAKEKLDSASYLKLMETLPLEIQNLRAYALTLKEQANNYRALSAKANAETKTENDLRKWRVENLRLENEGKSVSNIFAAASQEDKLKIIKANLSEAQFEARMAEIRKMDMEGYSALHRLLFSEIHSGDDFKKAANLMHKQAFRDALGF